MIVSVHASSAVSGNGRGPEYAAGSSAAILASRAMSAVDGRRSVSSAVVAVRDNRHYSLMTARAELLGTRPFR